MHSNIYSANALLLFKYYNTHFSICKPTKNILFILLLTYCKNCAFVIEYTRYNIAIKKRGEADMNKKVIIDTVGLSAYFVSSLADGAAKELSSCGDRYEILYVVSGCGKYIVEGEESSFSPGFLFLTRPLEYAAIILDEKSDFDRYVISFEKSELSEDAIGILDFMLDAGGFGGIYYSNKAGCNHIASVFERLCIADNLGDREKKTFCIGLLSELLALLCALGGEKFKNSFDTLFSRVTRYINANIQKELSLDILSHRFFVSKYYLCRAFKQKSGTSIHSYINQKRVLYAKQLIESGETASRAAERVGFGDYSAFYRAYTKYQGVSPASVKQKGEST